jgi:hypothetical protein
MSISYRWLEPKEISDLVNPVLEARGWALLNVNEEIPTCRVLGAWEELEEVPPNLLEVFVFQLYPLLGPLIKIDNSHRDSGEVSRTLAKGMEEFLSEVQARGYLAIADSPITERLCKRFSMTKVESPVFNFSRPAA